MKRILVPVDFSKISKCAAEVASQVAKKSGAKIILLHVIDFPVHDPNFTSDAADDIPAGLVIGKALKERLEKFSKLTFFEDVSVSTRLSEEDNIYETVASVAEEEDVDLIIMGSHSRSKMNRFLIGSNTDKVVRISDKPILSVKKRHENFGVHNVAFASNFFGESYTVFESIKPIIELYDPMVHLVKVITPVHFEPTRVSRKLIEDFAERFNIKKYTVNIYNDEKVELGINRFANETGADLIAMETHGGNSIYQLIAGSIMEDVMESAEMPVLTIRIKEPQVKNKGIFPDI